MVVVVIGPICEQGPITTTVIIVRSICATDAPKKFENNGDHAYVQQKQAHAQSRKSILVNAFALVSTTSKTAFYWPSL